MPGAAAGAKERQSRWHEIVRDSSLQHLPYKVETNGRGQIVLSPHKNRHSFLQKAVLDLLDEHTPDGVGLPEFAIATPPGVKVPDVVWMSEGRWEEMQKTGDPTTLGPEICVEGLSGSNNPEDTAEKRALLGGRCRKGVARETGRPGSVLQ